MVFSTIFACQFCRVVHSGKNSISQHQDSHIPEFRSSRPTPTLTQQEFHPKEIIRAVRSLCNRGKRGEPKIVPEPVAGVELWDQCSGWNLVVQLNSWAERRAHIALDRTELTCAFWKRFVDAGLTVNGGSDPRVGTGWVEFLEAEAQRERYLAIAARRRLEQEVALQEVELDQQRLEAQALWDDAEWEEYQGNDADGDDLDGGEPAPDGIQDERIQDAQDVGQDEPIDAAQDVAHDQPIDAAQDVVHDEPIDAADPVDVVQHIDHQVHAIEVAQPADIVHAIEPEVQQITHDLHPGTASLDNLLQRVANVEAGLSSASPNLHDASPHGKGKGKGIATNSPPPSYTLPADLACNPDSYYRLCPNAAQTENTISGPHRHDNAGSSLAGNHGPININQAANILTTRDNTILAPSTPRRSKKRVAQSPLPNPRVAERVAMTLRLVDTGIAMAVRAREGLATTVAALRSTMPLDVRDAFVGIHGAGVAPPWAEMEDAEWSVMWNQRVWERVLRRAAAVEEVVAAYVNGEWRFE